MRKIPLILTLLVVAAVVMATSAFTKPLTVRNGVVTNYAPGSSITIRDAGYEQTYLLRGFGSTAGTSSNGSTSSSSSSSSSASAATATATTTGGMSPTATASASGGTGGTSGSGSTSGTANSFNAIAGLGVGARVTIFGECFSAGNGANMHNGNGGLGGAAPSGNNGNGTGNGANGRGNQNGKANSDNGERAHNIANENNCVALFVLVRAPTSS